ncbi:hypothetical protein VTL71DRAFT_16182 [Oculimacula yallundae]|uniref:Uncharacterized protein n=1 Tax=Oculimacula yallundae TaxID=86028 RepID=A0ABR4CDQ7_9HELO
MLSAFNKLLGLMGFLLSLTNVTTAVPSTRKALENFWEIFNSTNRVLPAPLILPKSSIGHINRRDVQLATHSINLEPGVDFLDCIAAPTYKGMCTFSYVEHSSWQSHVVLHIYDEFCNQIGENTAVPRDFLADPRGWGFSSSLPLYLVLHVPRLWNQDQPGDVNLKILLKNASTFFIDIFEGPVVNSSLRRWDYGNNRNMGAFANNMFGDTYASTLRVPSVYMTGDREGSYTVGRAGFLCTIFA